MKYLNIFSWIFVIAGIITIIIAFLTDSSGDPWRQLYVLVVGALLIIPGLIGLLIFYIRSLMKRAKEHPEEQAAVIKKKIMPTFLGILYIIIGIICFYLYFSGHFYSDDFEVESNYS